MKNSVKAFSAVIVAVMSITFSAAQFSPSDNTSLVKSKGYVPVNGLKMYYEIYGEGDPIVLLHGSYMTIDLNFGVMIPALAKTNRVIALEMQGHGRTSDISRPFSYASPADDVGGL